MADFGFFSGKDDSAVEDLISQAKDLYVLEQVAAINCSGFTDSSLPTNLETRFRRLKSLPVSRPDPVSSSKKLLSHSKSMSSHHHSEKKNRGNASSGSAFSGDEKRNLSGNLRNPSGKSFPLVSSFEETRIFSGIKRDPSVISDFEKNSLGGDFSDSGKIGSSSSRFSQEGKIFSGIKRNMSVNSGFEKNPRGGFGSETSGEFSESGKIGSTSSRFSREEKIFSPTLKLLPKEKSRISSSSFTSIDLSSPSSDLKPEKPKSKFSISWFDKLSSPSQAMGCLWRSPSKSSSNSKKTKKSSKSSDSKELTAEEQRKKIKIAMKESKRMQRRVDKLVKRSKALRGPFWFMVC